MRSALTGTTRSGMKFTTSTIWAPGMASLLSAALGPARRAGPGALQGPPGARHLRCLLRAEVKGQGLEPTKPKGFDPVKGAGDADGVEVSQDRSERDLALHPRQRRSGAEVGA